MNMDPKLFESDENDEVVMRLRDRVNKEEKARIKAIEQAEFDKKQEEIKRKQAEMKVKLESITLLFLKKFPLLSIVLLTQTGRSSQNLM